MSFTQSQLDALNAMIASGVLRTRYEGKEIEYRSMEELVRARDAVRADLASSSSSRITHVNPVFSKGV